MLIAEIRNKLQDLTSEGLGAADIKRLLAETKEDLLTADVFGAIKYLPRRIYLAELLRTLLVGVHTQTEIDVLLADVESAKFRFWPKFRAPVGIPGGSTEPDVVIETGNLLVLFEMKLYAGLGHQQIERQLAIALDHAGKREAFVAVVTNGLRMPRFPGGAQDFKEHVRKCSSAGMLAAEVAELLTKNSHRVVWINWRGVQRLLDRAETAHRLHGDSAGDSVARASDLLGDLRLLLAMRGIREFLGVERVLRRHLAPRSGALFPWIAESRTPGDYNLARALKATTEPTPLPWCGLMEPRRVRGVGSCIGTAIARWPAPQRRCGLHFGGQNV